MSAPFDGGGITLPESYRRVWPQVRVVAPANSAETIEVTIWLRPREHAAFDLAAIDDFGATLPATRERLTSADLLARYDADVDDFRAVRRYCIKHHLSVLEQRWRALVVHGTIGAFSRAFGTTLQIYADLNDQHFRSRSGWLYLSREIASLIEGVFGLSEWPAIRTQRRESAVAEKSPNTGLVASQIERRYAFPPHTDGSGQVIGLLEPGSRFERGHSQHAMHQGAGPTNVQSRRVDGGLGNHGALTAFDDELALATHVIRALAPGAALVRYAAPDNERGFLDAIAAALFDATPPSVLSLGYGWPELLWSRAALKMIDQLFAAAALRGMTVCCATGNCGTATTIDGHPHVNAPASSRFALACGATTLEPQANGETDEIAGAYSGGGFSEYPLHAWQNEAASAAERVDAACGRGIPDVVAQGDAGFGILRAPSETSAGVTSIAAPLWAALIARLNERIGAPLGFCTPLLYAPECRRTFRRIERGSNGTYRAHDGWNPCTGLGAPNGIALSERLGERSASRRD